MPVKRRIWPELVASSTWSSAWLIVVLGGHARVVALAEHHEPERVAHLGEQADAAAELGIEQVVDALQFPTGLGDVVGEAGDPGLPGEVELGTGVPGHAEVGRLEVDVVRDEVERQRRQPFLGLQAGRHPVGRHGDVPRGRVAGLEVRHELLGVGLVVVVQGLRVVDGDAGLVRRSGRRCRPRRPR